MSLSKLSPIALLVLGIILGMYVVPRVRAKAGL